MENSELKQIASQVRRDIVRMVAAVSSGHPGGSLGCADFFTLMYFEVLKQDPRPPYKKQRDGVQQYGMTLYEYNIKWTVDGEHNHVTEIIQLP